MFKEVKGSDTNMVRKRLSLVLSSSCRLEDGVASDDCVKYFPNQMGQLSPFSKVFPMTLVIRRIKRAYGVSQNC
jgi:hypothetical protein